ncbi:MAG TPA: hypothetical protein VH877_05875 [Polyangia bacterium]|nr:hypothetical protein [Polyangia bacterium]
MAPTLEGFLACLYTDAAARARFLEDPRGEAARAGLSDAEQERLAQLDVTGLGLAAESFARKRAAQERHRAHRRRGFFDWLLGRRR